MSLIVTLREDEGGEKFFDITIPSILNYDPMNGHPALTTLGRLHTERLQREFPGVELEFAEESTLRMRCGAHDSTAWAVVSCKQVLEVVKSHQPRMVLVTLGSLPSQFFLQTSWSLTADEITMLGDRLDASVTSPRIPGWKPGTLHQLIPKLGGCKVNSGVVAAYLNAATIR